MEQPTWVYYSGNLGSLGRCWGLGSGLLTFGITVLEGDGPLVLGGEAPATRKAQSPSRLRLVGATGTWLAGLEPIHRVLARRALTCNEPRAQL